MGVSVKKTKRKQEEGKKFKSKKKKPLRGLKKKEHDGGSTTAWLIVNTEDDAEPGLESIHSMQRKKKAQGLLMKC